MPSLKSQFRQICVRMCALLGVLILTLAWHAALGEWADNRTSGIFQLRSEFALGEANAQQLLQAMARQQDEIERLLQLPPGMKTIEVNLFRNRFSYQAYLKQRVPEGMNRPALYVQGTDMGRVYVYRRWGYEQDIRHECTHAVLHNSLPYLPLWLDEGLAEYFEVPAEDRSTRNPHHGELKRRLLLGWQPDLPALEKLQSLNEMGAEHYRESWAWAHFLLHGPPEVRQILSDYLFDIQRGALAGQLSDRLLTRLPNVNAQLVSHLRNWR
ncbi:hypothetical protein [Planctomicrobium sp. SH664]|uniref:hypothetical protein n=1 Tax=Planctomicrobium sp. SH664 TaxID=3448125 RepID=UPI003F5BBF2F